MPGAGKTFLGKYAAHKLGVKFIDLDEEVTKHYNVSIAEIFKEKGETEWRKLHDEDDF